MHNIDILVQNLFRLALIVIYKDLNCGDLHMGFARVRCDECGHELIQALNNRILLKRLLRSAIQSRDIDGFRKSIQEITRES